MWVDNIKMDLRKIGWSSMNWIDLAQDRDQWRALVNAIMNLRVSSQYSRLPRRCRQGISPKYLYPSSRVREFFSPTIISCLD
jgi:hypothetical protein